ncbi:MAG: hypothetical protein HY841_06990, partial [Bacteroidetes bacterium]|nr:hypothetical protein [Bacteroidota bacterium]
KIMFDADSVMMGNTARVGNGQLSVAGNITASGDISSGTVTSGSIVTSQLIIDTLHALSRVAVNHSLMIEKQTAKSYAEVSTTDTAIALVLQKDSAGKGVGIGITPSAGERLSVAGNVGVSGKITSSQGFMFDNQNGFRYTPANGTSPAIFTLGKTNSVILPAAFCSMPIDNVSYAHMPQTQIFSTMQHDNVNSAFLMGSDWSTGNGTLEVEGTDNNGQTNNSLQINNFCGRNTYINTNSALPNRGGTVYLGDQVQMAHSAQIGWNFNPAPNYDINTALNIFPDNNGGNGIKLNTWTNNMPLISINNPSYFTPANSPFVVLNSNGVINATQYLLNGNALGEWITASNGTDIYNSNTGNVGIGTTTPTEKLHIQNGSIYIDGEGQGLIVNEGGHKRVGLMKYPGHEAGIWRASGQDFEIGRLDVSALPGTPTTFTTDIYVAGNGNVGIGTTNNPTEKLEVAGNIKATGIITNGKIQASAYASNSPLIFEAPIGTERARIDDVTGNFGIGTTTPQSKLDILNGSIHLDNSNGNPNDIWTSFGWRTILKAPLGSAWRTTDALNGLYLGYGMGTSGWYWVMSGATDNSGTPFYPMRLEVVGSEPNGMRLSVCGAVYAKKLRIENVVGCDFVFEKDHNKMTWQEKELYYKIYKRLPKMDAAAVMEKDGLDVGTNFSGLLQNVEEDRLDITELFIRIEKIENENKLLKEKIKELEKK